MSSSIEENMSVLKKSSDDNINEMDEITFISNQKQFYEAAAQYWENIPPTLDGVLGGFGSISDVDIRESDQFLRKVFQIPKLSIDKKYALDCGAGIGRVSQNLLLKFFEKVDLVEQNQKFLEKAKVLLGNSVGDYFAMGLQDFEPLPNLYDVIWCQWVLGHLNDTDLVKFFKRCNIGLKNPGIIIVKENVTSSNTVEIDKVDSSVTRPKAKLLKIFEKAGYKCIKIQRQHTFPSCLYPVYMFALKPCDQEK